MKGSVLVTGGARRIGLAICEALSARGWRVLAHSRDPRNPLCEDFTQPGAAERLFAAAVALAPDLCAVVNSAAVFSTAAELPPVEAAAMRAVNVTAPVRLAELLAAYLAARRATGAVVNLLDTRILGVFQGGQDTQDSQGTQRGQLASRYNGRAFAAPYAANKLALARATVAQARSLAPTLRVNGVAPGPVLPPVDAANSEKGGPILLLRRPAPSDVAAAVEFLLEAESVTGQILAVDSGQSLL